ncbi:MAG TPA: hypothetical protein VEU33_45690 [Archangium sp.]|nr:hypothetical protein [Archangium sp.]
MDTSRERDSDAESRRDRRWAGFTGYYAALLFAKYAPQVIWKGYFTQGELTAQLHGDAEVSHEVLKGVSRGDPEVVYRFTLPS